MRCASLGFSCNRFLAWIHVLREAGLITTSVGPRRDSRRLLDGHTSYAKRHSKKEREGKMNFNETDGSA